MSEILRLEHVSYTYHSIDGETPALHDVSFNVMEGEFVAIIGPNGCGKSTLLSTIAGLLPASNGYIYINNSPGTASGINIGYMLQTDQFLDWQYRLTKASPTEEAGKKLADNNYLQLNKGLSSYGLITFIDSYPSGNSDCIRQRAALVRSLLKEPDLLLLDEPFSALDKNSRPEVADDICRMLRSERKTVLLVTSDIAEAICYADRVIILSSRPGTVVTTFDIHLPTDTRSPSTISSVSKFCMYYDAISKFITG